MATDDKKTSPRYVYASSDRNCAEDVVSCQRSPYPLSLPAAHTFVSTHANHSVKGRCVRSDGRCWRKSRHDEDFADGPQIETCANSVRAGLVYRDIDQSSSDIARAFLEIQYRASPIRSPSHEGGRHCRDVNLDVFDAGV